MLGEPSWAIPLRDKVQAALDHAGNVMMIEDLYAFVLTGDMQIWTDEKNSAILVTEVVCYPRLKAIRSVITAGSLDGVKKVVPRIALWALQQGCDRAELVGRFGWKRVFGNEWRYHAEFMAAKCKDLV